MRLFTFIQPSVLDPTGRKGSRARYCSSVPCLSRGTGSHSELSCTVVVDRNVDDGDGGPAEARGGNANLSGGGRGVVSSGGRPDGTRTHARTRMAFGRLHQFSASLLGLVAAQNGATVVWLEPKIRFWLPLSFSSELTSDQQQKQEHNNASTRKFSTDHRQHKSTTHHCSHTIIVQDRADTVIVRHT
jgi:hypothetical protein